MKSSLAAICLLGCLLAQHSVAVEGADSVLSRMDTSGASFQAMSAKIKRVSHTAVLNDNTTENGTVRMKRAKADDLRVLMDLTEPDAKSIAFANNKAEIYYPKINTVQEYNLGKHKNLVEQYLLLGFGATGKDLQRNYSIKAAGEEDIQGQKTTRLDLTPKSAGAREHLDKVQMWITEAGYPVQQKLFYPSGDFMLITYTDVKWNPTLADDAMRLKVPRGVKREAIR
jgi:outer membrane lipoprotein-sorting protein